MKKRCFIAINLPPEVKWELERLISDLKRVNNNKFIKFVEPKQIHITLHFLGSIGEEQIDKVKDTLRETANNYALTELITRQISAFPDLISPQVIFLETQELNGKILAKMQKEIREKLAKIGLEVDSRPWTPHLTLARIKAPTRFKTDNLELSELSFPVEKIDLMESQLNSYGPEYKIIESYKLIS